MLFFCNVFLDVLDSFANILPRKREKSYTLFVILLLCGCLSSLPLPHGAVGSSVVGDCGIPGHTHLFVTLCILINFSILVLYTEPGMV